MDRSYHFIYSRAVINEMLRRGWIIEHPTDEDIWLMPYGFRCTVYDPMPAL
jgi:hypothetical protein